MCTKKNLFNKSFDYLQTMWLEHMEQWIKIKYLHNMYMYTNIWFVELNAIGSHTRCLISFFYATHNMFNNHR